MKFTYWTITWIAIGLSATLVRAADDHAPSASQNDSTGLTAAPAIPAEAPCTSEYCCHRDHGGGIGRFWAWLTYQPLHRWGCCHCCCESCCFPPLYAYFPCQPCSSGSCACAASQAILSQASQADTVKGPNSGNAAPGNSSPR